MKNKRELLTAISIIFVFLIVATTLIVHSQKQDDQNYRQQRIQQLQKIQQDVPIANYNELLPDNIEERTKRVKKNRVRNLKLQPPNDPRRFALTEESESTYGLTPNDLHVEPAIPAKRSDAIIVGEVINGEAHLSEDKVSIYSEFAVRNLGVLKNTSPESFSPEKPVIVSREGGGVRFPSGKVIFSFVLDRPMPKIGRIYAFFLKYSDETGFSIITAYELMQRQVFPLDGIVPTNGAIVRQFAGHQSFKGAPEADFLNRVKAAIANNSDVFIRK
ncbi:MAG: hypothetical protein ACR2N3_12085 [Pyrinomonadaceae bacterium]